MNLIESNFLVSGTSLQIPIGDITPAKINDEIYCPVNRTSSEFASLVSSIRSRGLLDAIIVTADRVVVSGHRRLAACQELGWPEIPVKFLNIHSTDTEFSRLLVEANSQRTKTADMVIREAGVLANPEEAHERYKARRETLQKNSDNETSVKRIWVGSRKNERPKLSDSQIPFFMACEKILEDSEEFWPMSVRHVHYRLLNDPPLKHAKKPNSRYKNDLKSYKATSRLLTTCRVDGNISYEALEDETRDTITPASYDGMGAFVKLSSEVFLAGYRRDLLQDQDDMVVVVAEKLTVKGIIQPVCNEFGVTLIITRGYCDIGTRHNIVERFEQSGKRRLILVYVTDHDPEGVDIPHSFTQSLVNDMGLDHDRILSKQAAITLEQAKSRNLTPNPAKETSSRFSSYMKRTRTTKSWELEALEPVDLQSLVRDAILEQINHDRFNTQIGIETTETAKLELLAKETQKFFATLSQAPSN